MQLKKSKKSYRELKLLRAQLIQKKRYDTYVSQELTRLQSGVGVDINIKKLIEQVIMFPKFLLSLIVLMLLIPLTCLLSVMLILTILVMYVKDLVLVPIRLLWTLILKTIQKIRR